MKERVVVALSGGVDSSVAAALLLEQGCEVIGVTMRVWECAAGDEYEAACRSASALEDARGVAAKLGIPFYVLDFREDFHNHVIEYFTAEYLRGRTPNPCVACNRFLKFGALQAKARELGAAYLATGHYARICFDEEKQRYLLLCGADKKKDQSYVLYTLTQEQLAQTLLPLGAFTKAQIRQKAADLGLALAQKAESQEICFIPDDDYKGFLRARAPAGKIKPGFFLNTSGEVIGRHEGLPFYTIGQRKGLGLALGYPAYVVALDQANNNVIVGRLEENYQSGLIAVENNFIAIEGLHGPLEVEARIRYKNAPASAVINPGRDGRVEVRFALPQRAITPGQSVVYYAGEVVIGGGIIAEIISRLR